MRYPFKSNKKLTLGVELELQIINPETLHLASKAKDLIRSLKSSPFAEQIKPEITQGMIELNSEVHSTPKSLHAELIRLGHYLKKISSKLNVAFCGGGTHPFERWNFHKIFPTSRFRHHSKRYGFLSKRFTVFSMHVHVGCQSGDDAVYLTHMLARYIPQLITLSASSPFYEGVYTEYHSTRLSVISAFPLSGHMPMVKTWKEFAAYYLKMQKLKIIESMKDFYWDIRPKAEFGTVEIRICDIPCTVQKAAMITAYIQTLVAYLLDRRASLIPDDMYLTYEYNRFQAARKGYDGIFINPFTHKSTTIHKDILHTLELLHPYAASLGNSKYLRKIKTMVKAKSNDATELKKIYKKEKSLEMIVKSKCQQWNKSLRRD